MGDEVAAPPTAARTVSATGRRSAVCLDVFARMLSEARFEPGTRSVGLEIEPK
jgi:hypothetical protein